MRSTVQQCSLVSMDDQACYSLCPANNPGCWVPPAIAFGVATLFAIVIVQQREPKKAVSEMPQQRGVYHKDDPRAHARALARARQATHISKAVALLKAAEPAKAYMELTSALTENSICRSPSLDGKHTKEEFVELYRLHIQNCEVPPNFATLLQLQEMLGLSQEEAEQIELDVLSSTGSFSI